MDIRLALVVGELVCGVVGVGAVGSGGEPVSHRVVSVGLVLELRRAGVRVKNPEGLLYTKQFSCLRRVENDVLSQRSTKFLNFI